jgi:hypothetical protein
MHAAPSPLPSLPPFAIPVSAEFDDFDLLDNGEAPPPRPSAHLRAPDRRLAKPGTSDPSACASRPSPPQAPYLRLASSHQQRALSIRPLPPSAGPRSCSGLIQRMRSTMMMTRHGHPPSSMLCAAQSPLIPSSGVCLVRPSPSTTTPMRPVLGWQSPLPTTNQEEGPPELVIGLPHHGRDDRRKPVLPSLDASTLKARWAAVPRAPASRAMGV